MVNRLETRLGISPGAGRPSVAADASGHKAARGELPPLPVLDRTPLSHTRHLLRLACTLTGASHGGVGLLSIEGKLVEFVASGLSDELTAELWHSTWLSGLVGYLARLEEPACLRDLSLTLPPGMPPAGLTPIGPFLGIALDSQNRRWGVLYLARPLGAPPFTAEQEQVLRTIAAWLRQGNLVEEGHQLARLRLLSQLARAAASHLVLSDLFTVALRELDRHLPSSLCAVWLVADAAPAAGDAPDTLTLAAVSDTRTGTGERAILPAGLSLLVEQTGLAACVQQGQALYVDLARPEERLGLVGGWLAVAEASVSFSVPLRAGERTVGVLQGVCFRPAGFSTEQIQLFYLAADLLGPAISNCQLYEQLRGAYEDLRLTQQRLIQTEKMRALGELAGGMAHEFNNSLCGTLGLIELALHADGLPPTSRQHLESARTCAWDAAQTVRKVQLFARQQPKEQALQPLDLGQLLRQTIDVIRMKWEQRQRPGPMLLCGPVPPGALRLEVQANGPARVCGDASELRQVITNLAFNAIDAMPDGGVLTLRVWTSTSSVNLSVQDTGAGIPEAVRHRLFEPFFSTKGERGNGLGLSVVYGIVQRHGGQISVESEMGHGSTFTLRLPAADRSRSVSSPTGPSEMAPRRKLRLLVIDDEDHIRRFLAGALAHLGYQATTAADAEEGVAVFTREPFDLVITDLILPGGSGEEVARAISRFRPGTPVVMLTGQACCFEADKALPEGVTCLLGKPIGLDTLAATLVRIAPV